MPTSISNIVPVKNESTFSRLTARNYSEMNIQKYIVCILIALSMTLFDTVAHSAEPIQKSKPFFIVTSRQMNGHATNENLNDFLNMKVEEFAGEFHEILSLHGMQSEIMKVEKGQNPTTMLVAKLKNTADQFAYVCQVYWKVDEKQDVNIAALFLPASYQNGTLKFDGGGDQRFVERRFFLFSKGVITESRISDYAMSFYDDLKLEDTPKVAQ
ncbi:hypothetical protein [Undibacterium sp. TJN19]|uniref:hypothetical protein n=1 Tax=Undibacterium sp. TJN19 TaxID=3413055 RepID=UPI003BF28493